MKLTKIFEIFHEIIDNLGYQIALFHGFWAVPIFDDIDMAGMSQPPVNPTL